MYEKKYSQSDEFKAARETVNTPEQIKRADFYINKYNNLKTEMNTNQVEWEEIDQLYQSQREEASENAPNSFDPIILPVVEGQVAAMSDKTLSASVKGEGFSDQRFAHTGQILVDYMYRNIRIRSKVKEGARRYLKYGNGCFCAGWDPDALDKFGLPDWRTPDISKVFVDGKIKSILDVEKAEYIIEEIGSFSILSAIKDYGEEIASAVSLGNTQEGFSAEYKADDDESFTKLHVWTRNNEQGNLQRLEISLCGIMLKESDPKTPFYEHVENQYPYKFFGLYPKEGVFYRFGDGKILTKLQKLLNNLWDECIIAAKYSAQAERYVDPNAGFDPDQLDGDPSHPIMVREPKTNVHTVQGSGINQIVLMLINLILTEVQRITRFSQLMMGSSPAREITATQSGIMVQQGNMGIDDKKGDISEAIAATTMYMIGLMMEFWPAGKAVRITEESEEIEWVDARHLKAIPAMIPSDTNFSKRWTAAHPDKPVPQFMQLVNKNGEAQTRKAMFDIQVSIGEGVPTNKMALLNVILSMSKMVLPDEVTGQPRSLLSYQQVQKMIEDIMGIPLSQIVPPSEGMVGPNGGTVNQNVSSAVPVAANPYIEGATENGTMSTQPPVSGGK